MIKQILRYIWFAYFVSERKDYKESLTSLYLDKGLLTNFFFLKRRWKKSEPVKDVKPRI